MIDLENALKFPTTDKEWKRKILIGGVLNIAPIIINFFPIGYAYRIFQKALKRQKIALVEWDNWADLFIQGLIVFLIGLLYNIASLILFAIHPILGILAFIAAALLFPMALAQYAMSGNFSQAFQLRDIWGRIRKAGSDYFVAWLVMAGIFLILWMIIAAIPILGWVISAILGFYTCLVFAVLFGEICSRQQPPPEDSRKGSTKRSRSTPRRRSES
ncbi:MAG: DUF4013 domain-containing protein [Proteobacteria bacterium]|nr:DUF4013 domain-containing protein [Pseudomonadota bacterium]NIS69683.1 DUF4013 domain-containing protein [Pseudomonadota bacterium]